MFETDKDVLEWYEKQPRAVTKDFVESIPWGNVSNHALDPAFVPVLTYMRDVEFFTDMYYRELRRTPTGKDPIIRKFMDRWSVEENQHADLLNRFLEEAGVPTSEAWRAEARAKVPWRYSVGSFVADYAATPFGKYFHAAHMVWGAINEITTLQGYRRLSELASHPVLNVVLDGIIREESLHSSFYWNLARVKLHEAKFSRDLARFIIRRFWTPVGQGAKPASETHYVLSTLFRGKKGLESFERSVSNRIARLPGFDGFTALSEHVAPIVRA